MTWGGATFGLAAFGSGLEGAPITNLGFELGTNGFASPWEIDNFSAAAVDWAVFGDGLPYEDFEDGWGNTPFYFDAPTTIAASFTGASPSNVEAFELGWSNDAFMRTTFPQADTVFASGDRFDDFESGWSNDSFVYDFVSAPSLCQGYLLTGGGDAEEYETGWSNDTYLYTFAPADLTSASFANVRALAVENFENVKIGQAYIGVAGTDALQTTAHGLLLNYRVILSTPVSGAMPAPLAPNLPYYVQNVADANNFKLALTASAGAAIDITTAGTGLLVWSAPYEHWTTLMATI